MKGILYGIGVGPGDPELMTLKAVRMIRENEVIAVPGEKAEETVAYQIAVQAVPELADKKLLSVYMPMTHDRAVMEENHRKGAKAIEAWLEQGKNVVFLTLGDPTIYSTFTYLQKLVEEDGVSDRACKRDHFFLRSSSQDERPSCGMEPAPSCAAGGTSPGKQAGSAGKLCTDEKREKNGPGKRDSCRERERGLYGGKLRNGK